MNHKIAALLFLIITAINMSNAQSKPAMEQISWMFDKWVSSGRETTSYEEWTKVNDSLYEGASKTIKNGEIIFEERLKIFSDKGNIFYAAVVAHNPAPVYFKLISADSNTAVFENNEHDFPQKITYRIEEGNLHAFIEGPGKNGEWKTVDFFFNKSR